MITFKPASHRQSSKIQNGISQSGFTIIESLVAIVVVSILLTAIAPVMVLSVGNRVQAKRVEMATQAAREYIDGVTTGTIEPPKHLVELNEVDSSQKFNSQRAVFAGIVPPSTAAGLSCSVSTSLKGNSYCSNTVISSLYCIDFDQKGCSSNSVQDLIVQAFRSITPNSQHADQGSYLLGVRVYRADAFSDNTPLVKSDPETKRTQATFTGGLGNRKAPLVETTTEVVTNKATMQDFCDRFGC